MTQIIVTLDIDPNAPGGALALSRLTLSLDRLAHDSQRLGVTCQVQVDGTPVDQNNLRQELRSA